ncbi:MAG: hypothetical protein IPP71_18505 [Bacteroidetes bacterium]|nr:hypothetical protein [Bacteroidota bacterium]
MIVLAHGSEIIDYLPQRPPVVMIDKLIYSGSDKTVSGLMIDAMNIFTVNGHFLKADLLKILHKQQLRV